MMEQQLTKNEQEIKVLKNEVMQLKQRLNDYEYENQELNSILAEDKQSINVMNKLKIKGE